MWFSKKQHSASTRAILYAAFPSYLHDDVEVALQHVDLASHEPSSDSISESLVDGSAVKIPYRTYFPPTSEASVTSLSPQQKAIFASFMTRNHDGVQREYWAKILCANPFPWAAPYLAALLGDYVIQVLDAVRESITDEWTPIMNRYSSENQMCLRMLNHRILTYWTIYYRYQTPNIRFLTKYPGYIVAEQLGLWDRRTAPKLIKKANKAEMATPRKPSD